MRLPRQPSSGQGGTSLVARLGLTMNHSIKRVPCSIALLLTLVLPLQPFAQASKSPGTLAAAQAAAQAAPPPSQIASAHTVFLTKAADDPNFPIDPTQSYNDIYAALKAWGHYQMVSAPDQADLVFQLHGVSPVTGFTGTDGDVSSYTSPAFQLTIRDPKSNVKLWTITSPVTLAGRNQSYARWVTISETNLVSRNERGRAISGFTGFQPATAEPFAFWGPYGRAAWGCKEVAFAARPGRAGAVGGTG